MLIFELKIDFEKNIQHPPHPGCCLALSSVRETKISKEARPNCLMRSAIRNKQTIDVKGKGRGQMREAAAGAIGVPPSGTVRFGA